MTTKTFTEPTTQAPYVRRSDISTSEGVELVYANGAELEGASTWNARLDGRLSTGEWVEFARTGPTFAAAIAALEEAITENGWDLK